MAPRIFTISTPPKVLSTFSAPSLPAACCAGLLGLAGTATAGPQAPAESHFHQNWNQSDSLQTVIKARAGRFLVDETAHTDMLVLVETAAGRELRRLHAIDQWNWSRSLDVDSSMILDFDVLPDAGPYGLDAVAVLTGDGLRIYAADESAEILEVKATLPGWSVVSKLWAVARQSGDFELHGLQLPKLFHRAKYSSGSIATLPQYLGPSGVVDVESVEIHDTPARELAFACSNGALVITDNSATGTLATLGGTPLPGTQFLTVLKGNNAAFEHLAYRSASITGSRQLILVGSNLGLSTVPLDDLSLGDITSADVNGDGYDDLIATTTAPYPAPEIVVFFQNSAQPGMFTEEKRSTELFPGAGSGSPYPTALVAAEGTNDSDIDLYAFTNSAGRMHTVENDLDAGRRPAIGLVSPELIIVDSQHLKFVVGVTRPAVVGNSTHVRLQFCIKGNPGEPLDLSTLSTYEFPLSDLPSHVSTEAGEFLIILNPQSTPGFSTSDFLVLGQARLITRGKSGSVLEKHPVASAFLYHPDSMAAQTWATTLQWNEATVIQGPGNGSPGTTGTDRGSPPPDPGSNGGGG